MLVLLAVLIVQWALIALVDWQKLLVLVGYRVLRRQVARVLAIQTVRLVRTYRMALVLSVLVGHTVRVVQLFYRAQQVRLARLERQVAQLVRLVRSIVPVRVAASHVRRL